MLVLVNTNRMRPAIVPVGLEYTACAAGAAGVPVEVLDLGLAEQPRHAMEKFFSAREARLIGLTFRNVDDCFWPSAQWFVPELTATIEAIRRLSEAPIVLGGVGFSVFPSQVLELSGADFGICGDGEAALPALYRAVMDGDDPGDVPGLVWRDGDRARMNPPAWPDEPAVPTLRDMLDNAAYLRLGGQVGIETKRGCNRACLYCADPVAKGRHVRRRRADSVADEVEALLAQGVDMLHICDSEFNIPYGHATAVCDELIRRRLGERVRWYTYMAVTPFDDDLAGRMRRGGCVGINFTTDSASDAMLRRYGQPHGRDDIGRAVAACRRHGMRVMLDLLLGGPGETPETVRESIEFFKRIDPDCIGAGVGLRIYPGTPMAAWVQRFERPEQLPGLRRRYEGPLQYVRPTFYIAPELGPQPARLVREMIDGDPRFFEPALEEPDGAAPRDHNYNDNTDLIEAIRNGARGAYWDILRQMRSSA